MSIAVPSFRPPSRKPYTPEKPRGAKAMTVAAGLVCNGGILLAADTEITYSYSGKRSERKLIEINPEMGCHLVYTADNCDFALEFFESLKETVKDLKPDSIVPIARHEFMKMLRRDPEMKPKERPYVEFLISVRVPDQTNFCGARATLNRINAMNIVPVKTYSVIGIGQELATAIFEHRFRSPHMSAPEAAIMLVDALRQVKRSAVGCGKSTNILAVMDDQDIATEDWGKQEIEKIEEECEFLEGLLNPLLVAFPGPMPSQSFESTVNWLANRLRLRRAERGL